MAPAFGQRRRHETKNVNDVIDYATVLENGLDVMDLDFCQWKSIGGRRESVSVNNPFCSSVSYIKDL